MQNTAPVLLGTTDSDSYAKLIPKLYAPIFANPV